MSTIATIEEDADRIKAALRLYDAHKASVRKYYDTHKDLFCQARDRYLAKLRADPEKYEEFKKKRRDKMREIRAKKKEAESLGKTE